MNLTKLTRARFSTICIAAVIAGVLSFQMLDAPNAVSEVGGRQFQLTPEELARYADVAEKGNCLTALKVAQHHLYASLKLREAEKYFRLAAKCPNTEALAGLITVLRKPEHDAEVDDLLIEIEKLDTKRGEEARQEVELRRAERKQR